MSDHAQQNAGRSTTQARKAGRPAALLLGPIGWPMQIVTVALAALTLWWYRIPLGPWPPVVVAAWTVPVLLYIGKTCAGPFTSTHRQLWRKNWRRALANQLVLPASLGLCFLAVREQYPLKFAVFVSAPALERQAAVLQRIARRQYGHGWRNRVSSLSTSNMRPKIHPHGGRDLGLFPVSAITYCTWQPVPPETISFTIESEYPARGLYFSGRPLPTVKIWTWGRPHHIFGPWYWWRDTSIPF